MKRLIKMSDDVFVLPSHQGSFGSTMIKENACGIPVMASLMCGATGAGVHGQTGLLVSCGDHGDMSRAIEKACKYRRVRARMMGGAPQIGLKPVSTKQNNQRSASAISSEDYFNPLNFNS